MKHAEARSRVSVDTTEYVALRLMADSEITGGPVVVLDRRSGSRNYYRVAFAFTGREEDIDEVVTLMQEKYPNAGLQTVKEMRLAKRDGSTVIQMLGLEDES